MMYINVHVLSQMHIEQAILSIHRKVGIMSSGLTSQTVTGARVMQKKASKPPNKKQSVGHQRPFYQTFRRPQHPSLIKPITSARRQSYTLLKPTKHIIRMICSVRSMPMSQMQKRKREMKQDSQLRSVMYKQDVHQKTLASSSLRQPQHAPSLIFNKSNLPSISSKLQRFHISMSLCLCV